MPRWSAAGVTLETFGFRGGEQQHYCSQSGGGGRLEPKELQIVWRMRALRVPYSNMGPKFSRVLSLASLVKPQDAKADATGYRREPDALEGYQEDTEEYEKRAVCYLGVHGVPL